ncbi:MAG: translation elongation factor Ts [Actinomycetota bacterium]
MTEVSAQEVKALREATGAGMMDCKKALTEAKGDVARATEILREKGLASAAKRAGRAANMGVIEAYVHFNHTVGVLLELNCETDFVANTDEFRDLARDVALHIASLSPQYVSREQVPDDVIERERKIADVQARELNKPEHVIPAIIEGKLNAFYGEVVLLDQKFVKDDAKSIQQVLDEVGAKVGERIAVRRFSRFRVGDENA